MVKILIKIFVVIIILVSINGCTYPKEEYDNTDLKNINSHYSETIKFNSNTFDVVKIDTKITNIKFYWKNNNDENFESIDNLKKWLEKQGKNLIFATNGGIFSKNYKPEGLYIENGEELTPINLEDGKGNFYLKPNGIFFVNNSNAGVIKSLNFSDIQKPQFAIQSGPLLVINNSINQIFNFESQNKYIRSGVGIDSDNNVVFAISNEPVNFYDLAKLFKEKLKCQDALYLDGFISKMYIPKIGRNELDGNFAVIIGITE